MSSRVFTILLCVLLLTTALIFVRRLSEQNEATVTELAGGTLQTQESAQPPAPLADARSLNVSDPADGATGLRRLLEANPEVRGLAASVSADIQTRFADFVAGLNLPADRELQVWNQLQLAYEEIYGAAAMLAENPAALSLTDPDYVLNRMAEVLEPDELASMEYFLEDSARERFLFNNAPQLELVAPNLNEENQQMILETLFVETYSRVNPDGIGNPASLGVTFQHQLDAIRATRESLRQSMGDSQFAAAEEFLQSQAQALETARQIFTPAQ